MTSDGQSARWLWAERCQRTLHQLSRLTVLRLTTIARNRTYSLRIGKGSAPVIPCKLPFSRPSASVFAPSPVKSVLSCSEDVSERYTSAEIHSKAFFGCKFCCPFSPCFFQWVLIVSLKLYIFKCMYIVRYVFPFLLLSLTLFWPNLVVYQVLQIMARSCHKTHRKSCLF